MKFFSRTTLLVLFISFIAHQPMATAFTVAVDYDAVVGTATTDSITIPNPGTGIDIVVTPRIAIDSGAFTATFDSDAAGLINDGDMAVRDLTATGEIEFELASSIEILGFPISVTASLAGPLLAEQVDGSQGALVDGTTYVESSPGAYNITAGPLSCSDSAFGVFCGAIQQGLSIEFPIPAFATESTPLPFAVGAFSDLNTAASTASNELTFSVPVGDANTFGAEILFRWEESGRELITPEPTMGVMLPCLLIVAAFRRRR